MNLILMSISALEWGVILFLLLWTFLTIIFQFTRTRVKAFVPWALFGFLPSWIFFAPNPGVVDYHLLYRDHLVDGTMLPWREALPEKQHRWMPLWNPQMRQTKSLIDATEDLKKLLHQSASPWLEISVPYLLLLHIVTNNVHAPTTDTVQFLLMASNGFSEDEPEVVFLSRLHPLSQTTLTEKK